MKFSILNKITSQISSAFLSLDEFVSILRNPAFGGEQYIKAAYTVKEIRAITDESKQKALKQTLPVIAPGVVFGKNRQEIKSFSGLMQIDIDHVTNPEQLRDELGKLSWVTLSALSVRKGVWLLIKIPEPQRQAEYWAKVNDWLWNKHGVIADPARKNPKDLRFYSPDSDAVYNTSAIVLPLLPAITTHGPALTCNKPKKSFTGVYFSPIDDFNANADVLGMLLSQGWKLNRQVGENSRLTRPGKRTGISANWNATIRKLYVFTSNSEFTQNESRYPLSPTDIFMQLNHISCIALTRQQLLSLGYGLSKK
jgi:hypothetical protein